MASDPGRDVASALAAWLSDRLDGVSDVEVGPLSGPSGNGGSNETLLGEASWSAGGVAHRQPIVVRVKPRSLETAVFFEDDFELQRRVITLLREATDIPVPEILWHEHDPSILGEPFWVMARVDGLVPGDWPSYNAAGFVADASPDERYRLWRSALDALVRIHTVDPALDLSFLQKPERGDTGIDQQLSWWLEMLHWGAAGAPLPAPIDRIRDWVVLNQPAARPTGLSWGDARVGNMIFGPDFACRAVLDWEMVSLGGPLEDLGWWLVLDHWSSEQQGHRRLDGLGDRDETIARWTAATGLATGDLGWYEVFAVMRMLAIFVRQRRKAGLSSEVDAWLADSPMTQLGLRLMKEYG